MDSDQDLDFQGVQFDPIFSLKRWGSSVCFWVLFLTCVQEQEGGMNGWLGSIWQQLTQRGDRQTHTWVPYGDRPSWYHLACSETSNQGWFSRHIWMLVNFEQGRVLTTVATPPLFPSHRTALELRPNFKPALTPLVFLVHAAGKTISILRGQCYTTLQCTLLQDGEPSDLL